MTIAQSRFAERLSEPLVAGMENCSLSNDFPEERIEKGGLRMLSVPGFRFQIKSRATPASYARGKIHARQAHDMKIRLAVLLFPAFIVLPAVAAAQSLAIEAGVPTVAVTVSSTQPLSDYTRPTRNVMVNNYLLDTLGPYPVAVAAVIGGIDQYDNSPPEWGQGAQGYGKRIGSNFGIEAIGTTSRFALAAAFKEDTLYYRCDCAGVMRRTGHAVLSTVTARHGRDGHRAFSFSSLLAPYAGATAAVYGWYPGRYGAKDAFRMGNYTLLTYVGGNIALEFFAFGPHSLLSRMHMTSMHGAPESGLGK
jgi:hypothetical protein